MRTVGSLSCNAWIKAGTTSSAGNALSPVVKCPKRITATLAADASGKLLVCWLRSFASATQGTTVRCSQRQQGQGWSAPAPALHPPVGAVAGYPAVAVTQEAWWLLSYQADSAATRVLLSRSQDGRTFIVSEIHALVKHTLFDGAVSEKRDSDMRQAIQFPWTIRLGNFKANVKLSGVTLAHRSQSEGDGAR